RSWVDPVRGRLGFPTVGRSAFPTADWSGSRWRVGPGSRWLRHCAVADRKRRWAPPWRGPSVLNWIGGQIQIIGSAGVVGLAGNGGGTATVATVVAVVGGLGRGGRLLGILRVLRCFANDCLDVTGYVAKHRSDDPCKTGALAFEFDPTDLATELQLRPFIVVRASQIDWRERR